MIRFVSACLLCFVSAIAQAQSPTPSLAEIPVVAVSPEVTPTAQVSPLPSATKKGRMTATEILNFHILLAENDFALKKDMKTRSDLVSVYERAIGPVCMPELFRSLVYTGKAKSEECVALIKKITDLDPYNPSALCAHAGIDSPNCRLSYRSLTVSSVPRGSSFQSNNPMSEMLNMEERLIEARREKELKILEMGLGSAGNRTEESMARERATRIKMLALACTYFKTQLVAKSKSTPPSLPTQQKSPQASSDSEFAQPDPAVSIEYARTRLISDQCSMQLKKAEQRFPDLSAVACHRYGYYSPQCIDAKRKERQDPGAATTAPGKGPATPMGDIIGRF